MDIAYYHSMSIHKLSNIVKEYIFGKSMNSLFSMVLGMKGRVYYKPKVILCINYLYLQCNVPFDRKLEKKSFEYQVNLVEAFFFTCYTVFFSLSSPTAERCPVGPPPPCDGDHCPHWRLHGGQTQTATPDHHLGPKNIQLWR